MTLRTPLRILLFAALLSLALLQLRLAVIAQCPYSGLTPSKAVRRYQQEPRLLVAYGREALFSQDDLNVVEQWYCRALRANPLYIPAWIALAELQIDEGKRRKALAILTYIDGLMNDVARWRWDKTMLAYQLDQPEMLKKDLAWLASRQIVTGQTRTKALKLAFSLWPEAGALVSNMGKENILPLFQHAVRTNTIGIAHALWPGVDRTSPESKLVLPYINRLISNRKIPAAASIWKKYYPSEQLLYNGNFGQSPIMSGFGWRTGKSKGVATEITPPTPGLYLRFDGTENVNAILAWQIVPLSPEHNYRLAGKMKGKGLTTDQRPFVEILGFQCSMRPQQSAMAEATPDWTPFQLKFTLPASCHAIQIRIRRKASGYIDSLINGEVWYKNFALHEIPLQKIVRISELNIVSKPSGRFPDRAN